MLSPSLADDGLQSFPLSLEQLFTDNVFLNEAWHSETLLKGLAEEREHEVAWRLKERMKTAGVALVVCLNLGTDPPDVVKPVPCARRECWIDPIINTKNKNLDNIGHALQQQYEKWQSKAKYKQCLDPTSEDVRRVCMNLRKAARNDRLLLHYNGHGVPKPTKNGELWVFGKHYTHYMPVAIFELRSWLGDPAIYVLDCSGAGALLPHFVDQGQLQASVEASNHLSSGTNLGTPEQQQYQQQQQGKSYGGGGGGGSRGGGGSGSGNSSPEHDSSRLKNSIPLADFYSGMEGPCIVLAACRAHENLPLNALYPADIFTSCLTTPLPIALRWFILQNPFSMGDINPDLSENIPGKEGDRKTPKGELNWIFTAITDTIAWTTLPSTTFQKMFRQDLLVASLFRNFLLAKRIMRSFNCTPQSWPPLPDSSTHSLWQAWDLAVESCLSHIVYMQRGASMVEPKNNMALQPPPLPPLHSAFFTDNLTAFEVWLEFGGHSNSEIPSHLPILLQVLLSQTHRLRALLLLRRYLALGPKAVNLALVVGIFPYILKLLQSPAAEIRQVLVCIWASILGFDPSCRIELMRDKSQSYFVQYLVSKEPPPSQRCMAAFVLAEICNNYREGQQTCLQLGLHRACTSILGSQDVQASSMLKKWVCLALFKLMEGFCWAKYVCLTEAGHTQLYPLLEDTDPTVRAAAVLAIGEIFGASDPRGDGQDMGGTGAAGERDRSMSEYQQLKVAEQELAMQILESCTDGSVIVRREALIALSKFVTLPAHSVCVRLIAKEIKLIHQLTATSATGGGARGNGDTSGEAGSPSRTTTSPPPTPSSPNSGHSAPWIISSEHRQAIAAKVQRCLESLSSNSSSAFSSSGSTSSSDSSSAPPPPPKPTRQQPVRRGVHSASQSILEDESAQDADGGGGTRRSNSPSLKIVVEEEGGTSNSSPSSPQSSSSSPTGAAGDDEAGAVHGLMAASYVRLWLAFFEVQGKDPHPYVANTAGALINWINVCLKMQKERRIKREKEMAERAKAMPMSGTMGVAGRVGVGSLGSSSFGSPIDAFGAVVSPEGGNGGPGAGGLFMTSPTREGAYFQPPAQLSPLGSAMTPNRMSGGGRAPPAFPFSSLGGGGGSEGNLGSAANYYSTGNLSDLGDRGLSEDIDAPLDPSLSSHLYTWLRSDFLSPDPGYPTFDDPLSVEGSNRLFREERLRELLTLEQDIVQVFRDAEEKDQQPESVAGSAGLGGGGGGAGGGLGGGAGGGNGGGRGLLFDKKAREDSGGASGDRHNRGGGTSHMAAALPPSVSKFEQKAILNIDKAEMTSMVMFHSLLDVLAVSDGYSVGVWSLGTGTRIMQIRPFYGGGGGGTQSVPSSSSSASLPTSSPMAISSSSSSSAIAAAAAATNVNASISSSVNANSSAQFSLPSPSSSSSLASAAIPLSSSSLDTTTVEPATPPTRITAMTWINESFDALLMLGADNGTVSIWRDSATTPVASSSSTSRHPPPLSPPQDGATLASAFLALPDVAETTRGSGLIFSWQQVSGTLVVGGNSSSMRVWDLGREQCVRVFATGLDTCTTALASRSVTYPSAFEGGGGGGEGEPLSWTFAGFADGTTAIFDERVQGLGRVAVAREHSAWVVAAYLRPDATEVITASVRGSVKFWDLRTMRTFKTLEVHKSPLTALAVHPCAPIMATGSHAQFIKILTLGGEQLGGIIKYHDGFLGQRIGPVSCLAFHPVKMLLAAGATDSIVSLYGTSI